MDATGDGSFDVQHSSFDEHNDTLAQMTARIQSILDDLNAQLAPMVNTWDGMAKDAYHIAQTNWNNACTAMHGTLRTAYVAADEIHNRYIRADLQGANQLGGVG